MIEQTLHDAFTQISSCEKSILIKFLHDHLPDKNVRKEHISKAIDYAVKECPSFGGYIMTIRKGHEILAATIVNATGMEGFYAKNILVYFAAVKQYRNSVGVQLLRKTIKHAKGDIAIQLPSNHPSRGLYETLGFKADKVELKYCEEKKKEKESSVKIAS